MKQRILLFTATAGIALATLMSNDQGAGTAGNGNRTGGPGATGTCSDGSCHAAAGGATTGTIEIRKKSAGLSSSVVTSYQGDTTYIVTVRCVNSGKTSFGFQMETLDGTNTNAGTFTMNSHIHTKNLASKLLVEHASPISAGTGGDTTSFEWKAPSSGKGTITFYGRVNACTVNGQPGDDIPSAAITVPLTEASAGVATVANEVSIKAYPNPVTNFLNIKLENVSSGVYTINVFDLRGRNINTKEVKVNSNELETYLDAHKWANGMYHVEILKDDFRKVIPVMKQQ